MNTSSVKMQFPSFDSKKIIVDLPTRPIESDRYLSSFRIKDSKVSFSFERPRSDTHDTSLSGPVETSDTQSQEKIRYKTLKHMKHVEYEKYLLSKRRALRFMSANDRAKEPWTPIPLILAMLNDALSKNHADELEEDYYFFELIDKKKTTINLESVFNAMYKNIKATHAVMQYIKDLNAYEIFRLLIIFVERLEKPPLQVTQEFGELLLAGHYAEPISIENRNEDLEAFKKAVHECDVHKENWLDEMDHHLDHLFGGSFVSRAEKIKSMSRFRKLCLEMFAQIYPISRQYMAKFILRNLLYQVHLYERRRRSNLRSTSLLSPDQQNVFLQERKIIVIDNISKMLGPAFLCLPEEIDSIENRSIIMTRLLWHIVTDILYKQQSMRTIEVAVQSCHEHCPCGFGDK